MNKNKILIISPYLPTLDEGGRIRLFYAVKYISNYMDVYLICFIYSADETAKSELIKPYCKELHLIEKKHIDRGKNIISKLYRIFFMPPDLITKRYANEMQEKVNELLHKYKFDIIQCLHQYTVQYIPENIKIPTILIEHNIESEIFKRAFKYRNEKSILHISKYKFRNWIELQKLRRYEEKTWKKINHIITVSEIDKNLLNARCSHPSITVIPNGVDTEYYKMTDNYQEDNSIIFTGTFSHQPNLDALLFFYNEIFPKIKEKIKDIKFTAAGKNLPDNIKSEILKDKNIFITGYVDDIRPYIAQSKLFVAPIRIGSGTRLKILQAMAMNKCVISTTIGCEGIDVENDKSIIIRNNPTSFAEAVVELLRDDEKRKSIANAGYKIAIEKYDWNNIFKKKIELYRKILY